MLPKVSIIIPYNSNRGWLYDCINSIFKSDYNGDIEVVLSKSNGSVSYNINRAIEIATGDYIKFIAEDDMITSNCISDSLESIKTHDAIHGNAYYIRGGKSIGVFTPEIHEPTLNQMLSTNRFHGGTLFYKASVLKENMFDESLWTGEEYELNLRLLKKGVAFGYCDKYLTYNRRHEKQKSVGNLDMEYQRKRTKEIERIKRMYWL